MSGIEVGIGSGDIRDRVTILETYRKTDNMRLTDLEQEFKDQLKSLNTKMDSLIEANNQRKGIDTVVEYLWDAVKLIVAALAGVFATRYFGQ